MQMSRRQLRSVVGFQGEMSAPTDEELLGEIAEDCDDEIVESDVPEGLLQAVESLREELAAERLETIPEEEDVDIRPMSSADSTDPASLPDTSAPSTSGRPDVDGDWGKHHLNFVLPSFDLPTGVPADLKDPAITPLKAWLRFLPKEMIIRMVDETNKYAEHLKTAPRPPFASKGSWPRKYVLSFKPTNVREMVTFIAILYLMGLRVFPAYTDHWRTHTRAFRSDDNRLAMTRVRFETLRALLHIQDAQAGTTHTKKIGKWLEDFRVRCETNYYLLREVVHDEQTVGHKGRWSSFTHVNKNKPAGQGFKIYSINDRTGYTWTFAIDLRTGTAGVIASTLLAHVERLSGHQDGENLRPGHIVYMDNHFTKPGTLVIMRDKYGTYGCGSWRVNHGFSDILKKAAADMEAKERRNIKGLMYWAANKELKLRGVVWKDSGVCRLLSPATAAGPGALAWLSSAGCLGMQTGWRCKLRHVLWSTTSSWVGWTRVVSCALSTQSNHAATRNGGGLCGCGRSTSPAQCMGGVQGLPCWQPAHEGA